jgi:hypothetical protein
MKDIELNPLDKNQRKLLQWGVVLMLLVFLIGYFFVVSRKNITVYLENQNLHVFDESMTFSYPDRLSMHYPYLLVVKPEKQMTHVYNLEYKTKEKEIHEVVLDYQNSKLLTVRGASTFFEDQDLGVLCEKGVIKSESEVLCVVKIDLNSMQNKLIAIDIRSMAKKDLYISKNLITELSVIDGKYYLGEIGIDNQRNFLVVDGKQMAAPNLVSMIYVLRDKPYFASFKSVLNQQKESYYEINGSSVLEQKGSKITLYK